jgi:tetratricopeptide (TPR) repeat protein
VQLDADNPVVALCAEGMTAEGGAGPEAARALFEQAWELRRDDVDACIAAHYLARQQPSPELTLAWNERALRHAEAAADDRIAGFFPSLHLNLGKSHEDLGDRGRAREHYERALAHADALGDDGYGDMVRRGVEAGLRRVGA